MTDKRWFHVVVGQAVWGFAVDANNYIIDVPPIAYWMKNKQLSEVRQWFIDNKAFVREIK